MTKKVSGAARGILTDAGERWLRQNDPSYSKRGWGSTSSDMLARALSTKHNEIHDTLVDLQPLGNGGYLRAGVPWDGDADSIEADTDLVLDIEDLPVADRRFLPDDNKAQDE